MRGERRERVMQREDWPTVSVIVPNWNGLRHLETCFRSLEELDYPRERLELIMVDNGSVDGSVAYMRDHFPRVRILQNPENLGTSRANNWGAREATGTYLAFLNNDTRVDPAWLKELVRAIEAAPDIVCAGSRILTWDGDRVDFEGGSLNFYGMGFQPAYGTLRMDHQLEPREIFFACCGSMLIDRQVFLGVGGFDEDFFAYFEDVDLGWRLWILGYRVVLVPTAVTYHRLHGTASRFRYAWKVTLTERNILLTILKNYEEATLQRVLPAALLLMLERAYLASGVDGEGYRLGKGPARPSGYTGTDEPGSRFREVMREEGFLGAVRRAGRKGWREACRWFVDRFVPDLVAVPRVSISPLVAADDVAWLLPGVMERRAAIQRRRKRSDAEIAHLFREPFRPYPDDGRYQIVQDLLVRAFDVEKFFPSGG